MATESSHFHLIKPESTDYYNISVFNTNTDTIDGQMYSNQVNAAKLMVGARADADGESGRVPAPTSAERGKYLKGDGTWDTPSGGGGGSSVTITPILSTGTKIAEYEIDGVGGDLYAPDVGSESRRYLGQLIERVTGSDSHISASSEGHYGSTTWYGWGAFTNTTISNWSIPQSGSAWVDSSEQSPTIQYHFDSLRYFTQLEVKCGSNYSSAYTGTIYIEASNDGTSWTDIGNGGQTINAPLQSIGTNTYSLDDTDTWEYIRIRGAQSFFIASNPSCFIQDIFVYGGDVVNGIDASLIDFSTLTAAQILYLKQVLGITQGGE